MVKERIEKEMEYALTNEDEEIVGFFGIVIAEKDNKTYPTVIQICDKVGNREIGREISDSLFKLFDTMKPIFVEHEREGE